jgi:hypothetical protein
MKHMCSSLRRISRLAVIVPLAGFVLNASLASAQSTLKSAQSFALLAGAAVTCTSSTVTGDVGVWPGTAITQTGCVVTGTVHAADTVAQQAYLDFISAYNNLRDHPPACTATATATLAEVLLPGVYCVDATAKTGPLMLDAQGNADASWTFLVNGALTGTGFNVTMLNGGQPCNVTWWVNGATTMTTSKFLGTILAGAAITVTGGTFDGHALATAAATLTTGAAVSACSSTTVPPPPPDLDKCEDHHDRDHDGDHDDKDHDRDHRDHDKDHDKDHDRDHDKDHDRDHDKDHDKDRKDH